MSRKKKEELKKEVFLIIISFVAGGIIMILLLRFSPLIKTISNNNLLITKDKTKIYEKASLSSSIEKIYNAVVTVQNYRNGSVINTGTGFIYKVDEKYGYIITNEHVISDSDEVHIISYNDDEEIADILGNDPYLDLAVLRLSKDKISLVANIGNSNDVKIGDSVFTVGTPVSYNYRGSVTSGILSGKNRMVSVEVTNEKSTDWLMRVLQIDASINPGNSGGPLLNINGEVIGIVSMKLVDDDVEGMGFAIPIEYAMSHIESLEQNKEIKWPVLGINVVNVTDTSKLVNNDIKIPDNIKDGAVIVNIKDGTNAASSELRKGDIITKINNNQVKDTSYLRYELYQHQSGDMIEVTYNRNGKEKTTKIKLN